MKTWHKIAVGVAVGMVAGVAAVNILAVPTFGTVGKLYDRAFKQFGSDWRKQVEAGN